MEISRNELTDMIRKKLLVLFTFNISDIAFTLLLMGIRIYEDCNQVLIKVSTDPIIAIGIKVFVVGFLAYALYRRVEDSTVPSLRAASVLLNICMMAYVILIIVHIKEIFVYIHIN